jgi:hypothetical protein
VDGIKTTIQPIMKAQNSSCQWETPTAERLRQSAGKPREVKRDLSGGIGGRSELKIAEGDTAKIDKEHLGRAGPYSRSC